jgi:hypothetical protein
VICAAAGGSDAAGHDSCAAGAAGVAGKVAATDSEGWRYAFNFGSAGWEPSPKTGLFIRVRTWRRIRVRRMPTPPRAAAAAVAGRARGLLRSLTSALSGGPGSGSG